MQEQARKSRWPQLLRHHPSAFLLAAQLLSLMLYPLMDDTQSGRLLFGAVALVVVPLAVWVVKRSASVNTIAWLLAVPAIVLTVISVLFEYKQLLPYSAMLEAALYFYAAEHGVDETVALETGMAEKSAEFRAAGAEVYRPE